MRFYSNVTEQDWNNLRNSAEQQKKQNAIKIKSRILKQSHVIKIAEPFSLVRKILDGFIESTEKLGGINENQMLRMKTHKQQP